jgi:YVTN family beta-propeller protein
MIGKRQTAELLLIGAALVTAVLLARSGVGLSAVRAASPSPGAEPSYEFFKSKVQPIFLKERPGHARCYGCHILSNRILRLEPLSPGSTDWTDEQSHKNFQTVLELVNREDPLSSKLLLHPLAPESGGDPFHSGGRQFASQNDPDWLVLAEWVHAIQVESTSGSATQPLTRIYVTNSASDTIDAIDPANNKVVQVIHGIELPHGIAFSADGSRIYVSNESESVLDVVNRKSGEILEKVVLSGHPNNLAITKDGGRVVVGIREKSGALDVIDTTSLRIVKSIPVDGPVHNVFITPDGKYAVSGSLESSVMSVVDLQSQQMVWTLKFDHPVRPTTFDTNQDGSTKRIFVQLSAVHGFAIVDFAKRVEVARIKLPDQPSGFGRAEGRAGTPSHGIAVAPDGKTLWVNSTLANSIFVYSLPDLRLIGHAELPVAHPVNHAPTGAIPDWIAFTPDSKFAYVADSALGLVSVIDAQSLKDVTQIPVGEVPKRMNTLVVK